MAMQPPFGDNQLTALSDIIAEHLTHSQISSKLPKAGFLVPEGGNKPSRIKSAFNTYQNEVNASNAILAFIKSLVDPVLFLNDPGKQADLIKHLNEVLSFSGYTLDSAGKLNYSSYKAGTISEAKQRASDFRSELINRNVHGDLLVYCKPELLEEDYFHAVFEAVKSYCDKIRSKTGIVQDGATLFDTAFCIRSPYLAINTLQTESEVSEQKGFVNLLKGIYSMFRNTTAHDPKIKRTVSKQDAIDAFTIMSYIHRRLDSAALVRRS